MSIDILGVLGESDVRPLGRGGCKIQRWLDTLDPETPGLRELIAIIDTRGPDDGPEYRTLQQTLRILNRVGFPVGMTTLHNHRVRTCRCSW